VTSAQ